MTDICTQLKIEATYQTVQDICSSSSAKLSRVTQAHFLHSPYHITKTVAMFSYAKNIMNFSH